MPLSADFDVVNSWSSGFIGSFSVSNQSGTASDGWVVEFDAPFEITNIWNAQIVSKTGNHYVIRNQTWNGSIAPNGTASFGFQAATTGQVVEPTGITVRGQGADTPVALLPALAISDVSLVEGQSGTQDAVFTVSLDKPSNQPISVAFATADGTASSASDYSAVSGTLVFAAGETSKTIRVPVKGDTTVEGNETFAVNLTNPTGARIADGQGTATITNDDAAQQGRLSVSDLSVAEGQSGTRDATFTITLSSAAITPVSVAYGTANGSATAGSDYLATSGTVTFAAGETAKTVTVKILGDTVVEGNETLRLLLSNPSQAVIADGEGIATIVNDDAKPLPALSVADVTVTEGNPVTTGGGAASGYFSTSGNQIVDSAGHPVRIAGVNWFGMESNRYAPDGLHARNYKDMMDQMVDLGFNTIRLPFSDQLFDAGSRPNGIDFSRNPDLQGLTGLQIMDKIVDYAGQIGLRIILDHHRSSAGAGANENGLWYDATYPEARWISDWEALALRYAGNPTVIGADLHNEPHGPATWGGGGATDWAAAAERAGNAIHDVNSNWLIFVEGVESYQGQYYWWGGNLMGVKDRPVVLETANKLVYSPHDYPNSIYGQPWFSDANFPNNLPAKFDQMWGYIYKTGTAPVYLGEFGSRLTDPKDVAWLDKIQAYLSGDFDANGTRDIPAGKEGISWTWWSWNPNSGDTGGILRDDWTSVHQDKVAELTPLMFDLAPVAPGTGGATVDGTTTATFLVTLSEASSGSVMVDYQTVTGTAGADDFTPATGTLTFAPGETQKTVTVTVAGDARVEGDEQFSLLLSNPRNATVADGTATGTVKNDDGAVQPPPPPPPPPPPSDPTADDDGLSPSVLITNDWGSGFTASVEVENTGESRVGTWTIEFDMPYDIVNIWNAEIVSHVGETYVIRNASWNGAIQVGDHVTFGFQASPGHATASAFDWVA